VRSTSRAACSNSAPTRIARTTTRPSRRTRRCWSIAPPAAARHWSVGKTLKDFGYATVYNLGGFKELADAGLETEPA
jgi:hypothetical protein